MHKYFGVKKRKEKKRNITHVGGWVHINFVENILS